MILRAKIRSLHFGLLLLALSAPCARALLNLEGTRNQIFVFGSVAVGYNSNIFYTAAAQGDYCVTSEAGVDLKRQAGIIGVGATAKITYLRFAKFTGENAVNPNLSVEFSKVTGRMTGSFSLSAYRDSRSDSALNLRINSWNIPVSLKLRYPINDKFYFTSQTGFLRHIYSDNTALTNYTEYTEAVDGYYRYTSKLDLVAGYGLRASKTTIGSDTYDHTFSFGASGALLAKINGTLRVGYQIRQIRPAEHFGHVNAVAALNWMLTRKLAISGQLSRDFDTIANGASVDTIGAALRANYQVNRKTDVEVGIGYGRNAFLATAPPSRLDHFSTFDVAAHYKLTEHLQLGASYLYLHNTSSLAFANFDRQGLSVEVSARY